MDDFALESFIVWSFHSEGGGDGERCGKMDIDIRVSQTDSQLVLLNVKEEPVLKKWDARRMLFNLNPGYVRERLQLPDKKILPGLLRRE